MKEKDFEELINLTRLTTPSREAARLVYVEGMSHTQAGTVKGFSDQRMSVIIATVRKAEQKQQALAIASSGNEQVKAIEASYAFAVKAARDQLNDEIELVELTSRPRMVGMVIAKTDFHLVQALGRESVVVHELAKLNKVPAVGKSVAIQYENGRGTVVERERASVGHSR